MEVQIENEVGFHGFLGHYRQIRGKSIFDQEFVTSYEYLIFVLETMLMEKMTLEYVIAHLMHEISKKKENKLLEN